MEKCESTKVSSTFHQHQGMIIIIGDYFVCYMKIEKCGNYCWVVLSSPGIVQHIKVGKNILEKILYNPSFAKHILLIASKLHATSQKFSIAFSRSCNSTTALNQK